jgi:hypothetical protein
VINADRESDKNAADAHVVGAWRAACPRDQPRRQHVHIQLVGSNGPLDGFTAWTRIGSHMAKSPYLAATPMWSGRPVPRSGAHVPILE